MLAVTLTALGAPSVVEARARITISAHDTLAPYGDWVVVERYGRVWRPHRSVVGVDFVPYATGGRWLHSNHGWIFQARWGWGWLPFHYGHWYRDRFHGWLWVPGDVWAPNWVEWRSGGGYIGWAPSPPPYDRHSHWYFVQTDRFLDPWIWQHQVRGYDPDWMFHRTRPIHRYGPHFDDVRRHQHRVVAPPTPMPPGYEQRVREMQRGVIPSAPRERPVERHALPPMPPGYEQRVRERQLQPPTTTRQLPPARPTPMPPDFEQRMRERQLLPAAPQVDRRQLPPAPPTPMPPGFEQRMREKPTAVPAAPMPPGFEQRMREKPTAVPPAPMPPGFEQRMREMPTRQVPAAPPTPMPPGFEQRMREKPTAAPPTPMPPGFEQRMPSRQLPVAPPTPMPPGFEQRMQQTPSRQLPAAPPTPMPPGFEQRMQQMPTRQLPAAPPTPMPPGFQQRAPAPAPAPPPPPPGR